MPKGKRGKAFKLGLDTSKGQQNQIGIVNKQKSTDPNASGQKIRSDKDGVRWRNDGRTGEGPVRPTKQAPKPTKTKAAEPSKTKKVKKGVPKVKPAEAETGWSRSKAAEAYRQQRKAQEKPSSGMLHQGSEAGTYTKKPKAKSRYRGKGVVGRR